MSIKITRSGFIGYTPGAGGGHLQLNDWEWDGFATPHEVAAAALLHIAQSLNIPLAQPAIEFTAVEREDLDAQRATLDVIAVARWREPGA